MSVRAVAVRRVAENDGEIVAPDDGRVWIVKRARLACRWLGLTVAGGARQTAGAWIHGMPAIGGSSSNWPGFSTAVSADGPMRLDHPI
jgi:hypothetical protein